jgi:hypothetical protein
MDAVQLESWLRYFGVLGTERAYHTDAGTLQVDKCRCHFQVSDTAAMIDARHVPRDVRRHVLSARCGIVVIVDVLVRWPWRRRTPISPNVRICELEPRAELRECVTRNLPSCLDHAVKAARCDSARV